MSHPTPQHASLIMFPNRQASQFPNVWIVWSMRFLAASALAIASYLAWTAFRAGDVIGCSADGVWDCGHVLHSRWSKVFGVPVSLPASFVYVSMLVALGYAGASQLSPRRQTAWSFVTLLAFTAGMSAIWFISLQLFVLRSLCLYCMAAHTIGLVLAAAALAWHPLDRRIAKALSVFALLAVAGLIASQTLVEPPPTFAIDYHETAGTTFSEGEDEMFFDPTFAGPDELPNELTVDEFVFDPGLASDGALTEPTVQTHETGLPVSETETDVVAESLESTSVQPILSQSTVVSTLPDEALIMSGLLTTDSHFLRGKSPNDLKPSTDVEPSTVLTRSADENEAITGKSVAVETITPARSDLELGDFVDSQPLDTEPTAAKFDAKAGRFGLTNSDDSILLSLVKEMYRDLNEASHLRQLAMATDTGATMANHPASPPSASMTPLPDVEQESTKTNQSEADRANDDDAADTETAAAPPRRTVSVMGGRVKLNTYQWPIVGRPDATHVLVELFDYTCPHCRSMNGQLKVACQRFGDQLAILTLPVPLSRQCNETVNQTRSSHIEACDLARLVLAVWRIDPAIFPSYHDWMFAVSRNRTATEARQQAMQLVGREALDAELAKPLVNQYIAKHVLLYKRAGQGTVPKLMTERLTLRGETGSSDSFCDLLERELNIKPVVVGRTVSN